MPRWGFFSKLRNKLIFYSVLVVLLSFVLLGAYHFHLGTTVLKQQTLSNLGVSEYLVAPVTLLKARMLLSILVVFSLTAIALYATIRRIVAPLSKITHAVAALAKAGDLTPSLEVDRPDEVGQLSRSFRDISNWMKEIAGAVSGIAEGTSDPKVGPRSEKDVLVGDLPSMIVNLKNSFDAVKV